MSVFSTKQDKVKKFEAITEGATKEKKREVEERLLVPEPLPMYDGPEPDHKSELDSRTALIVFRNKAQMDTIGKLFSIRTSVNKVSYITDISLLEEIAKQVHAGEAEVVDGKIRLVHKETEEPKRRGRRVL